MEKEFLNKTIFGKFKLTNLIGKGSYSLVFSARNLIDKNMVAVKIQDKSQIFGNLEKEAYYLYTLKGIGIPKIISYGIYKKYNVLVEQLLGKSLQDLFINNTNSYINKIKRQKDIIISSIQVLERIEYIHSKLILHLDIKPDNFLFGESDSSLIYVIDFGFAQKYRSSRTGKHMAFRKLGYFNGNLKYSSVNTMKGVSPSRRDDLESLGYMIIYLYNQKLPWENLKFKSKDILAQKIYELKLNIKMENLCINMPEEMIFYMNYVKSLKFEQDPNYNYLRDLFQNLLKKISNNEKPHFSWIDRPLNLKDSDFLGKPFKKRRQSPFSRILNKIMNKSTLEAKLPKLQMTTNLKLKSFEKDINLTQRMKDVPKMFNNNNNNNSNNYNNNFNLEKDQINNNEKDENENLKENNINMINKRFEIKRKNIILRNQYHNLFNFDESNGVRHQTSFGLECDNIYNKRYINNNTTQINTTKIKVPIINNRLYSPTNLNHNYNDISDSQIPYNPSTSKNKSINYNFLITPYIANKTINIYSNNSNKINSNSNKKFISPQNQIKKILLVNHNSSNNIKRIAPKNNIPFNRNANNMNFGLNIYMNSEKKFKQPKLVSGNTYFEQNINYKRKFYK